jgi:uncharacterized protein YggE
MNREVEMLKRVMFAVVAIALSLSVGLVGVWLWGQASGPAAAQTSEADAGYSPAETIIVVGQGSVKIRPDIARVSIGVETSGAAVSEAVAENETRMQALLEALEKAGIAEEDIQTMNYSIQLDRYPETVAAVEPATGEAQPLYRVSNMVNVTIRDLESVGDVLDAVVEAGANNIWGITFAVDDPSDALADARADAIEDARARAGALAELSGVSLGPVMSVSEVVGATPVAMSVTVERAAAAGGSISPGELEISYQAQVTYFIER